MEDFLSQNQSEIALVTAEKFEDITKKWQKEDIEQAMMACLFLLNLDDKKLKELDKKGIFDRIYLFFGGRRRIFELLHNNTHVILDLMSKIQVIFMKRTDMLLDVAATVDTRLSQHICKYNEDINKINSKLNHLEKKVNRDRKLNQIYLFSGEKYKDIATPKKIVNLYLDIKNACVNVPLEIESHVISKLLEDIKAKKTITKHEFLSEVLQDDIIYKFTNSELNNISNEELIEFTPSEISKEIRKLIYTIEDPFFISFKDNNCSNCFDALLNANFIKDPDTQLNCKELLIDLLNDMDKEFLILNEIADRKKKEELLKKLLENIQKEKEKIPKPKEYKAFINYHKGKYIYNNGELKSTLSVPAGLISSEGIEITDLFDNRTVKLSAQEMYIFLWAKDKSQSDLCYKDIIAIDWGKKVYAYWYKFDENGKNLTKQGEVDFFTGRSRNHAKKDIINLTKLPISECTCLLCFDATGRPREKSLFVRLTDKDKGIGAIPLEEYADSVKFDNDFIDWLFQHAS